MSKLSKGNYVRTVAETSRLRKDDPVIPAGSFGVVKTVKKAGCYLIDFGELGPVVVDGSVLRQRFCTWLVVGSKSAVAERGEDSIEMFEFDTLPELVAFIQGVDATDGWLEACSYMTEEEAQEHVGEYADETVLPSFTKDDADAKV